jgi:hypothetical protein
MTMNDQVSGYILVGKEARDLLIPNRWCMFARRTRGVVEEISSECGYVRREYRDTLRAQQGPGIFPRPPPVFITGTS